VLYHTQGGRPWRQALDEVTPLLDYVWICRPELYEKYAPLVKRNPATKVLYDTIDLHFVRTRREAELQGDSDEKWREYERRELAAGRDAHATIVVSGTERELLENEYA